jgi:hypothetical protein
MTLLRREPSDEEKAEAQAALWKMILLIGGGVIGGVVLLVLLVMWIGNARVPSKAVRDAETHIQDAGKIFMKYMQKNRGAGPSNEKQLADFLKSLPQAELEATGIKDRENVLISPRDNQPYGVVPNQSMMRMSGKSDGGTPVALYEKTGVGGKRYVLFLMGGGFTEMNDEQFRKAVPAAK